MVYSGYFSWCYCLYFSLLWVVLMEGCQMLVLLWVLLVSLVCGFPSSIFCKAEFVAPYYLNLFLSWNILFTPLLVNASFAGYSCLGLHPCSLSFCSTSIQRLLAFMISIEKSGVILIGFPLYVTWPFSLVALNICSLYCMFRVLIIIWWWDFFLIQSIRCSVCFLNLHRNIFL